MSSTNNNFKNININYNNIINIIHNNITHIFNINIKNIKNSINNIKKY